MNTETMQKNQSTIDPNSQSAPGIWIGLDWADKKHYLALLLPGAQKPTPHIVEQTPEALDAFFLNLRQQHPGNIIGVCLEQSRGPVIYALMKYDFVVIYPVNPRSLSDFRRTFTVSGAKSDPRDGDLLCEIAAKHHQRLRPLKPQDSVTRKLALQVEARRDFVDERTKALNKLGATLKCYYPLFLQLFNDNIGSEMARAFLKRWPNLALLKKAKASALRAFFYAQNSRSEDKIKQRLELIKNASHLTEDPAIIEPLETKAVWLAGQLAVLEKAIADFDEKIRLTFAEHADAWLFRELPGAGAALAPRLAAAFGTSRENWGSASELHCISGVAPVRKQSGKSELVQFRRSRPRFLHQTFVEFAKCSIHYSAWAKILYEHQCKKGKSAFAAIRTVAFKWMRILWRCWMNKTAYDEAKYIQSLAAKGIKLYEPLFSQPANVNPV